MARHAGVVGKSAAVLVGCLGTHAPWLDGRIAGSSEAFDQRHRLVVHPAVTKSKCAASRAEGHLKRGERRLDTMRDPRLIGEVLQPHRTLAIPLPRVQVNAHLVAPSNQGVELRAISVCRPACASIHMCDLGVHAQEPRHARRSPGRAFQLRTQHVDQFDRAFETNPVVLRIGIDETRIWFHIDAQKNWNGRVFIRSLHGTESYDPAPYRSPRQRGAEVAQILVTRSPWKVASAHAFTTDPPERSQVKVLVVSNAAWPVMGGIEVLLDRLLPALRDRGHEITLLTSAQLGDPEVTARHGIAVHRTQLIVALARRDPGLLSRERQRVKGLLVEVQPDLVHAHDPGPNLWAVVKAATPTPIVTTMHIGVQRVGAGSVASMAELLRASAWVTGVSRTAVEEVVAVEPSLAERTSVIENGIALPPLRSSQVVPGRVLCVGRLVEQKGFDLMLRALARVVAGRSDAHLVFAGDGAQRSILEALTMELGLIDRVTFLGAVAHADVESLLSDAQIVALPSRWEGQPLVALEAAAVGRPLLSTGVDGLSRVAIDGVTGVVVPAEDVDALAAGLARLLDDRDLCNELGASGRALVADQFGFDRCVDAYDELYRQILTDAH